MMHSFARWFDYWSKDMVVMHTKHMVLSWWTFVPCDMIFDQRMWKLCFGNKFSIRPWPVTLNIKTCIFPTYFPFDLSLWGCADLAHTDLSYIHDTLVMVATYTKWYELLSKDEEVMLRKQIFHLTLACALDLQHTDQNQIGYTLSCYGGHLCHFLWKSREGCGSYDWKVI